MKYIIMCGGKYDFETPKQLLEVKGERLIERTIRLLKENGIKDIAITSLDERFDNLGVPRIEHKNDFICSKEKKVRGFWVDAFLPSNEPITYLYGDVYYSDNAIKTIIKSETDYILFFGSLNINRKDYFKLWQEPFGFKVVDQKAFRNGINKCKELAILKQTNREPISWELYRVLNDYNINKHIIGKNYIAIDDYTTDIDHIEDIKKLEALL